MIFRISIITWMFCYWMTFSFLLAKSVRRKYFSIYSINCIKREKQIVLASDRAPKDLNDIEERLISRFKWGLTADLTVPDFETRMAILLTKMDQGQIQLPSNVMEFICQNIKSNIRELEGVLIRIIAESSLNFKKIDVELAKEVVQNYVNQVNQELTVESIAKIVCEQYKIPVERLVGKSRQRQIVMARQTAMYFTKQYTQKSLKQIGSILVEKTMRRCFIPVTWQSI